ncbi:cupin domain-containing protein [Tepidimonas charontis]|uniref:Gentisate 1,2-dioxygenase n=1 Tax=Tepidimonas charontis TaxID=2267262 RepID=A0A554XHC6_9BURK|nr:cupin domain-containing protein [Tepidimonas charontis]TSE35241.1 Gentisate 1,2-dioxygenase [Tepidimonas charontis]
MSDRLGRLDELPADYRDELRQYHLVPLWPNLRALLPANRPARATQAVHWSYAALRPLLLRAGELTPIDKAERRVLVLANPGHGPEALQATPAIYLGMQLLLPGEWAPAHRHTPNAVRMVVQGQGAWTAVDGERCPMQRGDLILTPSGLWHEHGHDGTEPVVWLDVLDLPLIYALEASYHETGTRQHTHARHGERGWTRAGLAPTTVFARDNPRTPLLRYPWVETRAALLSLAADDPQRACVQLTYTNPATGEDAQNILGFYALMLRPGQTLTLPARSPAQVFHLIDGAVDVTIGAQTFSLDEADTCCAPGYELVTLRNRCIERPSFLFIADEAPLHRKLGIYEVCDDPTRPTVGHGVPLAPAA